MPVGFAIVAGDYVRFRTDIPPPPGLDVVASSNANSAMRVVSLRNGILTCTRENTAVGPFRAELYTAVVDPG
jgi:hypothetical protein